MENNNLNVDKMLEDVGYEEKKKKRLSGLWLKDYSEN